MRSGSSLGADDGLASRDRARPEDPGLVSAIKQTKFALGLLQARQGAAAGSAARGRQGRAGARAAQARPGARARRCRRDRPGRARARAARARDNGGYGGWGSRDQADFVSEVPAPGGPIERNGRRGDLKPVAYYTGASRPSRRRSSTPRLARGAEGRARADHARRRHVLRRGRHPRGGAGLLPPPERADPRVRRGHGQRHAAHDLQRLHAQPPQANFQLQNDEALRDRINRNLRAVGVPAYSGGVEVRHLLWMVAEGEGYERMKQSAHKASRG